MNKYILVNVDIDEPTWTDTYIFEGENLKLAIIDYIKNNKESRFPFKTLVNEDKSNFAQVVHETFTNLLSSDNNVFYKFITPGRLEPIDCMLGFKENI